MSASRQVRHFGVGRMLAAGALAFGFYVARGFARDDSPTPAG